MDLRTYPRPQNDNGIGIHFRLDLAETDRKPHVSDGVQWLKQINAKWALVAGQDWNQIAIAAGMIWAAGIMPVCRLICKINGPVIDWIGGVQRLKALGLPPYIQIFNEPGDSREWREGTKPDIGLFGSKWGAAAAQVYDAGGYPGVGAVLGQDEWQAAFNSVQANNLSRIWDRAWFCVHNYGSNHPPSYPYDDANQKGTPVTAEEYARLQYSSPLDEVNALRASSAKPGATILTDDTSIIRFLEFKAWMVESLGYCLPMIGGEGGWEWGNEEDHRYSKLTAEQHASYHKQMFEWFSTGVLANGDPLPDELFCISPWIMGDWGADDWWYGALGTKQGTIDTVAGIAPFVRQFSWDRQASQAPVTQSGTVTGETQTGSTSTASSGQMSSGASSSAPTTASSSSASSSTPAASSSAASSTMPPTSTTTTGDPASGSTGAAPVMTYVVQHGDTLSAIARRFGTTVPALVQANHLGDPSKIFTGQKLTIPR
ncbi:MAG: LysM domain-containing protein [Anaerolineae bacterium]